MSGNELMNEVNEGVMENVSEVTQTSSHTLAKVAVVGAIVALAAGTVMYIRKRRKANTEETIVETEIVDTKNKTQK